MKRVPFDLQFVEFFFFFLSHGWALNFVQCHFLHFSYLATNTVDSIDRFEAVDPALHGQKICNAV